MNDSRAAIRYAKAILDLAVEKKAADAVEQDMVTVLGTVSESAELQALLANPVIKTSEKKEALTALFSNASEHTKGLFRLLVENKRLGLLPDVAAKYISLYKELKKEEVAVITTAVPLTEAMEKKALQQIAGITDKKVTLENRVDASILGGFILRMGDTQYDASIATKLNNIKREFTNSI